LALDTFDDVASRLTKEEIDEVGTQNDLDQTYGYDGVGNRKWKQVTSNGSTTRTEYTYNANDLLLNEKVNGVVTASYTYDNNGSTLTKTENGVTTTYTWDDEKRLIAATVSTGQQMQYRYNDQGIRVSSTVNGVETRYLLDEGMVANVWEEYSPTGQAQVVYVHGNDLVSQTQQNQTTFYLVDGLGSTRLLTNDQGAILNDYRYDAYGKTLDETGTVNNKYLFAGEQFDEGLGDYYLRQRYYDADSGRFTRRDTYEGRLDKPLTLHKYLYTHNNPINGIDPTGLFTLAELSARDVIFGILATIKVASITTGSYKPEKLGGFGEDAQPRSVLDGILAWRNTWTPESIGGFEGVKSNFPNHTGRSIGDINDFVRHVFSIHIDVAYDIAY